MPLIKIDYNEQRLNELQMDELVKLILDETMRIYNYGEDKISIFTAPYGRHSFSTAAVEIEIRAKVAEYEKGNLDKNELRIQHLEEYKNFLNDFIAKHQLREGIVVAITFEDWQVEWLPRAQSE